MAFHCLLCGAGNAPRPVADTLRDDSSGRHRVVCCPACSHVQLTPLPTLEWETRFHAGDSQAQLLFQRDDFVETLLEKKKPDLAKRLDWLRRHRAPGCRILEVASGYGLFVDGFAAAGYDAHGLEHSPFRLNVAKERMRGHFTEGVLDDAYVAANRAAFDVVFVFHRVLHARDPVAYLGRLLGLLAPGGLIYIEEPNLDDALMGQIDEYRAHRWQVSHYHYFTAATLAEALRRAGAPHFAIHGLQRYGVRHLLQWNDHRRPDLSGAEPPPDIPALARLEALYRQDREEKMSCDTMIAVVERP